MAEKELSLASAIGAVGSVTLRLGSGPPDASVREVPVDRGGLMLEVAAKTPARALLTLKHSIQRHIDLQSREAEINHLSRLLGDKLAMLLKSVGEQSLDETRILSMFDFLGTQARFAIQRDGALLVNEGLDVHTLHIARRRTQTMRVHAAAIDHGELFTCRCDRYEGYFQRDAVFSDVEKALIELHLNLLARHLRQQALHRALSNINETFSREFSSPVAGETMEKLPLDQADAAERNFETLLQAALKDSLTHAYNRHKTGEILDRLCRSEVSFAIILVDIDHFKLVNDQFGHLTGDRVLVSVARRLQTAVRDTDIVARWGGEEFLVVTPGSSMTEAMALAERIRDRVGAEPAADDITVTISLGVALAAHSDSRDAVVARADQALYRSKKAGRNRVTGAFRP